MYLKKKRRKGYRVKNGHRQYLTKLEIVKINEKTVSKDTKKKSEKKSDLKQNLKAMAKKENNIKKKTTTKKTKKKKAFE